MIADSISRAEVAAIAAKTAFMMRNTLGLKKGDRVALIAPNSTLYAPALLGIIKAGLTVVPLNPIYSVDELEHPVVDSDISAFFVFPPIVANVRAVLERTKRPTTLPNGQPAIWLLDEADSVPATENNERSFLSALSDSLPTQKIDNPNEDVAVIVYSSGTSGKPKGVQLTHTNLKAGTETIWAHTKEDFGPSHVAIAVLPMFHIFGLTVLLLLPYLVGMKIVVVPRFDLEVFCAAVQRYKVTLALVVPPMILGLAKHPIVDKFDLSSLRILLSGAAPLGVELGDQVEKRLPNVRVTQGYGLSETSPVITLCTYKQYRNHKGSCGNILPGVNVRLVDEDGNDVGNQQGKDGKPGEMWVKSDIVMKGYLNNPTANEECLTPDYWFKTGDIAICKDNYLYIVDRKKELIKYKGFQVPPAELEAILLDCPDVADVAVVGVKDEEQATELPRAYVVPTASSLDLKNSSTEDQQAISKRIQDWLAPHVANHKKLRGGVVLIEEIPKSASGKILRRFLRDRANAK
ncbi:hypothetical protein MPSI1_001494 [Malassezia psittaci]|uniref:Uncharacterized protein n=1 Tax=Malassezia psittaci TaxID=1821823 RepID=A0AAF0FAC3_9BASI|nr:hypothetical protein MPSI1_001494 [Malassezia psittaci]